MRLFFVSPHADDVCFSLLGTITSLYAEGVLVTVFSRSEWAEPQWEGPRGRELITAARAREDRAFCSAHGLSYRALGFEDSSIRHGLAGNLRRPDREDELAEEVAGRLVSLLLGGKESALFAPLGLGGHTDHRITRRACAKVAEVLKLPIVFYEDVPYAAEFSLRKIRRAVRSVDARLDPVVCLSDMSLESKVSEAQGYRSQHKEQILNSMEFHSYRLRDRIAGADPLGVAERLWTRGGEAFLREIVGPRPTLVDDAATFGLRLTRADVLG